MKIFLSLCYYVLILLLLACKPNNLNSAAIMQVDSLISTNERLISQINHRKMMFLQQKANQNLMVLRNVEAKCKAVLNSNSTKIILNFYKQAKFVETFSERRNLIKQELLNQSVALKNLKTDIEIKKIESNQVLTFICNEKNRQSLINQNVSQVINEAILASALCDSLRPVILGLIPTP